MSTSGNYRPTSSRVDHDEPLIERRRDAEIVDVAAPAHSRRAEHHGEEFVAPRDRVRWGPLWAGVMITLATFLVAQLAIFAAGLFAGGDAGTWLTAAAGLAAFFLGGLVVGATSLWHKASDGLLNGIIMWAFATVGLLVLALIGGGTLLGPVSTVAADLVQIQNVNLQNVPAEQVTQALSGARDAATWALLGLTLALVASAIGGMAGAKIWPRRDTPGTTTRDAEDAPLDVR